MKTRALAVLATITLSALAGCAADAGSRTTPLVDTTAAGVIAPDAGMDAARTPTNESTAGTGGVFAVSRHSTGTGLR